MGMLNSLLLEGDLSVEYVPVDLFINKASFSLTNDKIKKIPIEMKDDELFDRVLSRFCELKVTEFPVRVVGSIVGKDRIRTIAEHIELKPFRG